MAGPENPRKASEKYASDTKKEVVHYEKGSKTGLGWGSAKRSAGDLKARAGELKAGPRELKAGTRELKAGARELKVAGSPHRAVVGDTTAPNHLDACVGEFASFDVGLWSGCNKLSQNTFHLLNEERS